MSFLLIALRMLRRRQANHSSSLRDCRRIHDTLILIAGMDCLLGGNFVAIGGL
ncbi:hypothetical protein [Pseudomonas putida]|uniref:hypothetical protein n=1 Tax=Pseudomonas putida TaxID=303 RepID=UPI001E3EFD28|nr:hypothetical protein [Pseudomonas putida]